MEQVDDRILEHIAEDGWSTPSVMASRPEFDATEGILSDRCKMLTYAGFLAPIHGRTYELTTWGQLYLDGEIDAEHQPRPEARAIR